jgi:hypothetical protein
LAAEEAPDVRKRGSAFAIPSKANPFELRLAGKGAVTVLI